jgi:hypothetical protein
VKPIRGLTVRQEHFARLLAERKPDGTPKMTQSQCYAAAGYVGDRNNASQAARRPAVKARVDELLAKAERRTVLDISYVLDGLKTVAEASMERVPFEAAGGEIVDKLADASAANRALELLGKTMGAFIDRTQIDLSESTRKYIDRLVEIVVDEVHDPDTVKRLIARLEGELGGGDAVR